MDKNFDQLGKKIFEKIDVTIFDTATSASKQVAREIVNLIQARNRTGQKTVLGLATGSTPLQVYKELIRYHRDEKVSFRHVVTFNLDEYFPIQPDDLQSYVRYMHENLFNHIDIEPANIHIPDGTLSKKQVHDYCKSYERKIHDAGGLDIQLLGIGRTGHIGFNEPGSLKKTRTRLITLDELTRSDAAGAFFGEENVPRRAITMGVGTILEARKIYLMAWGEQKAGVIKRAVEGNITDKVPASYLQEHENTKIILDQAAASELTREKTPWLVGPCQWNRKRIRKAVTWLSLKVEKPILKLTDEDYNQHGLSDVLTDFGIAYNTNIDVFNQVQHTITGWPGGKPNADDTHRPERVKPFPKRVLIFSPHPDDDMLSMGGTLMRLVEHGHDVHIAYQTSGNLSVYDDEALRYADFISAMSDYSCDETFFDKLMKSRENLKKEETDSEMMRNVKTAIRQVEARAATRYCNVKEDQVHFLNMPFYETGRAKKLDLTPQDLEIVHSLMQEVKPHQIYAAGDLSDPHGTHRICWDAIEQCLNSLKDEDWMTDCRVWLYRGIWQDWDISEIDMAVPLSPGERMRKKRAIFKHASQQGQPKYPGNISNEFWLTADERTLRTAEKYDSLGLAEYEAIEGFSRWTLAK